MDGVLGLLLLRYSSNILHTPEINKKQNFINLLKQFYFLFSLHSIIQRIQTVTPTSFTEAMQEKKQTSLTELPWDQEMFT